MYEGNTFIYIHLGLMIISIAVLFITCLWGLFETEEEAKNSKSGITLVVSLISTVFLFGFYIFGTIKCDDAEWVISQTPYSVEKIMSLNDNNLTNGRFYMRRGYIEENLYYQYMVELNNGGFVANKVNSANATLFYAEDNYRVEWYIKTKSWLYWKEERVYNKIYIPEGSITDDYSIDLN